MLLLTAREVVVTFSVFLAEGPGICCFSPRAEPLFSALLILGDPDVAWLVVGMCVLYSATTFSLLHAGALSLPGPAVYPQLGTKVQGGITGCPRDPCVLPWAKRTLVLWA